MPGGLAYLCLACLLFCKIIKEIFQLKKKQIQNFYNKGHCCKQKSGEEYSENIEWTYYCHKEIKSVRTVLLFNIPFQHMKGYIEMRQTCAQWIRQEHRQMKWKETEVHPKLQGGGRGDLNPYMKVICFGWFFLFTASYMSSFPRSTYTFMFVVVVMEIKSLSTKIGIKWTSQ